MDIATFIIVMISTTPSIISGVRSTVRRRASPASCTHQEGGARGRHRGNGKAD